MEIKKNWLAPPPLPLDKPPCTTRSVQYSWKIPPVKEQGEPSSCSARFVVQRQLAFLSKPTVQWFRLWRSLNNCTVFIWGQHGSNDCGAFYITNAHDCGQISSFLHRVSCWLKLQKTLKNVLEKDHVLSHGFGFNSQSILCPCISIQLRWCAQLYIYVLQASLVFICSANILL